MFADKVIIITGASGGLGRELAIKLNNLHAHCVLFSRNEAELNKTAELCSNHCLVVAGDVTNADDCELLINSSLEKFGKIDILINNAGISQWQKFSDSGLDTQHKLMQTNYFGAVNCTHYALPHLQKTRGQIVAVSSVQGLLGVPYHTGYGASKHAVQGFFSALRNELDGTVNVLIASPSWIRGTNLRCNAISEKRKTTDAKSHGNDVSDCADKIIEAIEKRKKRLIMPAQLKILIAIKNIFPNLVDKIITQNVGKEHHNQ